MTQSTRLPHPAVRRTSVDDLVMPTPGIPFAGDPEITLLASAWDKIRRHAQSDLRREVGGLLLGEVFSSAAGQTHVLVRDAIPAPETVASLARVEFTTETWRQLLEEKAARFSSETILGWYHTHPGFGLFLSSLDLFIQRHFFRRHWHLALVVDPVAQSAAFFHLTPESVIQRDNFSLRVRGSELWEERPSEWIDQAPPPLETKTLAAAALRLILPLDQPPSALAAGRGWLGAIVPPGTVVLQPLRQTRGSVVALPHDHEPSAISFDDHDRLYILSRARRDLWRVIPPAAGSLQRLSIEGYDSWDVPLLSGLAVIDRRVLLWDGNRLLVFKAQTASNSLRLQSEFSPPDVRVEQVLRDGNHHLAVCGHRVFVNDPAHDRIEVVTVKERLDHMSLAGSLTALRQPLAIAGAPSRLFALDSEGARIVELSLDGVPIRQYLLDAPCRDKGLRMLAANQVALYLGANDGLYAVELPRS